VRRNGAGVGEIALDLDIGFNCVDIRDTVVGVGND
jgi:hypothetical protein